MTFTRRSPMSDYQDIYDWKSKPNFAFAEQFSEHYSLFGENEYGKTGHSKIFTFLRHFLIILKRFFSGLQYYTTSQTLMARRAVYLRFNIVKRCILFYFSLLELLCSEIPQWRIKDHRDGDRGRGGGGGQMAR